jgi:predicted Zn finger-like uncharacterized protein
MITKCPECGTLFRVTPQQLQARQGQVRCGRCMSVFDGVKTLITVAEPAHEPAAGPAVTKAPPFALESVEAAKIATMPGPQLTGAAETLDENRDFGPAPQQLSLDDEYLAVDARARRGVWLWAVGVALLALVLVAQAAYVYRGDLATRYPGLKPHLVRLCETLRCRVSPPQRPKQIAIEASDLQVADPARPAIIRLTATLRNHAGYDLGYPALDLVLTNTKEHTLARRIFLPREYLERGKDIAAGIPANAEVTIRLDLDTGDLNPAGFRLDLLPAPAP